MTRFVGTRVPSYRFGLVGNRRLDERHAGQNIAAGKVYQSRCPNDLGQIDVDRVGNLFASGRIITIFPGCKTSESPKDPFRDRRKLPSSTRTLEVLPWAILHHDRRAGDGRGDRCRVNRGSAQSLGHLQKH